MSTLRSGIDRFEADVAEYEARGQPKPSDEILRAVLLQLVPENLEEHLELNIQIVTVSLLLSLKQASFHDPGSRKKNVYTGVPESNIRAYH